MNPDRNEIAHLAESCAKCGACTSVCPVYQATGRESLTARGRLHLLSRLASPRSTNYGTIFSACLLCGACSDACPRNLDTLSLIIRARGEIPVYAEYHYTEKLLARKTLASPLLLEKISSLGRNLCSLLPETSGLRQKLSLLGDDTFKQQNVTPPAKETNDHTPPAISYFSGCLARYLSPDIHHATEQLSQQFAGSSLLTPENQHCCGLASFSSGKIEEARELAKKNIAAFADHTLPILTSCASCFSHLRSYPRLFADDSQWSEKAAAFAARVEEFSSFFLKHTKHLPKKKEADPAGESPAIFYHDPCHLRFGPDKILAQPRELIRQITGTKPIDPAGGPHCCGQGGLFHLAHPDLSGKILSRAMANFMKQSATQIVTTCSGCLLQLRQGASRYGVDTEVRHLAVLLASLMEGQEKI